MPDQASYHFVADYSDTVQEGLPGVVVPQQVYKPPAGQPEYKRLHRISFTHNGLPGIRLADALRLPIPNLHRAQSKPMLSETGTRVALRIMWPGYAPWSHQNAIDIFDHTLQANPATLERIAHRIATLFRGFCEEKSRERSREPSWQLRHDSFDKLYLVELRHVSKGSWQPVICWDMA
ncbi:hypothetical protein PsYK624_049470 [Phanerochaete sordida]|uniref:Uncharacterized protein n=1 Tax=Phanerochaete sordida TaxID=48140 RepID=A0A9P3G7D3_9APHY|nr:hypothetical protein PsYK624_049470 [Phanerochaete sordida]